MIVRLKDNSGLRTLYKDVAFQFYDSPIKSGVRRLPRGIVIRFQFYDSPIKRASCLPQASHYISFNSMIVRLKAELKRGYMVIPVVSIL